MGDPSRETWAVLWARPEAEVKDRGRTESWRRERERERAAVPWGGGTQRMPEQRWGKGM